MFRMISDLTSTTHSRTPPFHSIAYLSSDSCIV